MMKLLARIFSWFAIFCVYGFAKCALAINLMDAYELALQNDPTYRSAIKEYEAGQENYPIGRSAIMPKVVASYNQNANQATQWGAQYTGGPNTSTNWNFPSNYSYVQLTQPIFSLEAMARYKQGKAQADLSQAKYLYNAQDLLIRVLQTYLDLLYSIDQWNFQMAEKNAFFEQLQVNKMLQKKGETSLIEVLESESSYQSAEAKSLDARELIENSKRKLEAIIGEKIDDPLKIAKLTGKLNYLDVDKNPFEWWMDKALISNAELNAANHNVEIANQEFRKNQAGYYPVVNVVGAVSSQKSNTASTINQTFNQNYVGVQINLPIYSGGETSGRVAQAYANYEKARADYDVTREKVATELRKQFEIVKSGRQKVQALSAAENSGALLVNAMRKNVVQGERINVDVLLAEKSLFSMRRDLAQAKYGYLLALLKLNQLCGTLEAEDFQKLATYFK